MKRKYLIDILLSLPKTIIFNLRVLPFSKAIKLPFYVNYRTRYHGVNKKSVRIADEVVIRPFMIKFGNNGSHGIIENRYNYIYISRKGQLIFNGSAAFNLGFSIRVESSGILTIGKNFNMNRNGMISCSKEINFGETVLIGWNVTIRDNDGHTLVTEGLRKPTLLPISIGNHVWIGAETHILKGVEIRDNCVIAYKSLVTKGANICGGLFAGVPAKIIRENIDWDATPWDEQKQ